MDNFLEVLMSWEFALFSTAIAAVVWVLRGFIEYALTYFKVIVKESTLWNDVVLPGLPIILGSVGAVLIKEYPYPTGLSNSGSRFVFGLVAGFLSSFIYRLIKAAFNNKLIGLLGKSDNTATDADKPTPDAGK